MLSLLLSVAIYIGKCPSEFVDAHHGGTVPLVGFFIPKYEPATWYTQGLVQIEGTPRCRYEHEYLDAKGREAVHTIELRQLDKKVFHDSRLKGK